MNPAKPHLDIQKEVCNIREQVRESLAGAGAASKSPQRQFVAASKLELRRLLDATRRVRRAEGLVGQLPPQPAGLRARIGAILVRFVQRMLFWYTPRIAQFQQAVAELAEEQVSVLSAMDRALQGLTSTSAASYGPANASRVESQMLGERYESLAARLEDSIRASRAEHQVLVERHEALAARLEDEVERSSRLKAALDAARQALTDVTAGLASQETRLSVILQESHQRLPELPSAEHAHQPADQDRAEDPLHLDPLYAVFEDVFRGDRTIIKGRLQTYIPILRNTGAGGREMGVIDLGCGRGEWLELLADHGMHGLGVDTNSAMIARCESMGLPVVQADALSYLRAAPTASVGAITAFHLVEHLPFGKLIDILDEIIRVLKPGGLAILETPNPANVLVGSGTFYQDPTHRNPLPSSTLQFLAEARGLFRVEVLPLHPYPSEYLIAEDERSLAQRFNQLFYGPQDYAVIGRKV